MQHLTEFLTRLQTFNLRLIKRKAGIKTGANETQGMDTYDITRETQYYDSFSYKSELRILKDMALIDLLALDKEHIGLQLAQLNKVKNRFIELWQNYHQHYHDYHEDYEASYPFSIRLDTLFIVHNLLGDSADVAVTAQFVEDLADSIKLRETFLKELIGEISDLIKEPDKLASPSEPGNKPEETVKQIARYPTFTESTALQLLNILKSYFTETDYTSLSELLISNTPPDQPLVFRSNGNQLADAFKQLYDANLIVGCLQSDLEKWIVPKFLYLSNQGEIREFTEGYLNSIISTKGGDSAEIDHLIPI
jgi:hypothetical protein